MTATQRRTTQPHQAVDEKKFLGSVLYTYLPLLGSLNSVGPPSKKIKLDVKISQMRDDAFRN